MSHSASSSPCPHQATAGYWKSKYEDAQRELSALRRVIELNRKGAPTQGGSVDELITLVREETRRRRASDEELAKCFAPIKKESPFRTLSSEDTGERIAHLEQERAALEKRAQDAEQQQAVLTHQIGVFRAEASVLAAEAHQIRRNKLDQLFQTNSIVMFEEGSSPRPVPCTNAQAWLKAIPQDATRGRTLFFLPAPPHSLPISVPGWARSGYWFHPEGTIAGDREFELIIETKPNEWCYLGRYRTASFPGSEMRLSEWMDVDDETKTRFVARLQSQLFDGTGLAAGSGFTSQSIRKNYDTGVWSVPCYSLHCVGYSRTLHSGLHLAAMRTAAAAR